MKYANLLLLLLTALFMNACVDNNDDDDDGSKANRTETQAWIEDTMRDDYFWSSEIPKSSSLDYSQAPEAFFTSLLSQKDGKTRNNVHSYYSRIEDNSGTRGFIQEEYTYGFEFSAVWFSGNNRYGSIVLYVLPNSPAYGILQRGDWIIAMNGQTITDDNVNDLFGAGAVTFTLGDWSATQRQFINQRTVEVASARAVEYDPVFYADVLTRGSKKVGYLVYNTFTDGLDDDDTTYNKELLNLSSTTFSGVDEFVLDLRYNNGGTLSSIKVLSAILCPGDVFGKNLGYLVYNNGAKSNFAMETAYLNPGGKNLNLKTLYVLTTAMTASASEAIINFLDPYMKVVVIGRQTEGKNVGSQPFESDDKKWTMYPITSQIYNSQGKSDYVNGWTPDHIVGDVFDYVESGSSTTVSLVTDIYPLGDANERLLKIALGFIDGATRSDADAADVNVPTYKLGINSLARRASNGVITGMASPE